MNMVQYYALKNHNTKTLKTEPKYKLGTFWPEYVNVLYMSTDLLFLFVLLAATLIGESVTCAPDLSNC